MEAVGIACVALFIPILLIAAIVSLVSGSIGTLATRKNKDTRKIFIVILVIGLCLAVYVGRAFIPEDFWDNLQPSYKLGDEKLKPFENAINEIDRTSLGFSTITPDTEIKILKGDEEKWVSCPDIELYIPDLPIKKHHICIKKLGDNYFWDSEYEEYLGPNPWESIWFAYSSRPGVLNQLGDPRENSEPYTLVIEYWGSSDQRLENRTLTLEYVEPFLDEWKRYHEAESKK
jgi:hypothetical protein